jgi:hypothetical protein
VKNFILLCAILSIAGPSTLRCFAEERVQKFDKDPQWDGHNNRATIPEPRAVRQDFGYSSTNHAGTKRGEIGGFITPAGEPAYYAKPIATSTLSDELSASGTFATTDRQFHLLVGFFNADTVNEWRTPNSIVLRLYGRGDVFYAFVEYMTGRWRAGGDNPGGFALVDEPETGRKKLRGFASDGTKHHWSMVYDPKANDGQGSVTVKIDDETAICHLDPGHQQDGATFNRFGILSIPKHHDTGGEVWLDDLVINGETENFDADPNWDALGNRSEYLTNDVRPRFDFGFSETNFAGGKAAGEMGGIIFRGDSRDPLKLAYYGDRLATLSLDKPIRAAGKISMHRGISDSTSLFGFFHSQDSAAVVDQQSTGFPANFLGMAIEGPSRDGFFFYPAYRFTDGGGNYPQGAELPHIYPDGKSHDWSFAYDPRAAGGNGEIVVTFDGHRVQLQLHPGERQMAARFDRFGIVTTWIDGNAQRLYFDDLTYTCRQE